MDPESQASQVVVTLPHHLKNPVYLFEWYLESENCTYSVLHNHDN